MGGLLGIELAKRGRARSVVALSPGGGWQPGGGEAQRIARFFKRQLAIIRASDALRGAGHGAGARRVSSHCATSCAAASSSTRRTPWRWRAPRWGAPSSTSVLEILRDDDAHMKDLDQVNAPVLLAWAEYDRILPKETCSWRLRRGIPGAEYRVLPGVGHVPMWDDHHLVTDTIVDWVTQHTSVPVTA